MNIVSVFVKNLIKFDFLIFVLALINIYFLYKTFDLSKRINSLLHPQGYLPMGFGDLKEIEKHYKEHLNVSGESKVIKLRKSAFTNYSMYQSITQIFPLMGILGTVSSLIPMVSSIGNEANTSLFFSALTSTFWGIVFAIIFKSINGYLDATLSEVEKELDLYIERNTRLLDKDYEKKE